MPPARGGNDATPRQTCIRQPFQGGNWDGTPGRGAPETSQDPRIDAVVVRARFYRGSIRPVRLVAWLLGTECSLHLLAQSEAVRSMPSCYSIFEPCDPTRKETTTPVSNTSAGAL